MRVSRTRALAALMMLVFGCDAGGGTPADAGPLADGAPSERIDAFRPPAEWSFEVLDTRSVTAADMERQVELIRAGRPDHASTYLLYVRAPAPDAPMVVMTEPYAGVAWTGDSTDAVWASRGPGIHPDDTAPNYDGDDVIGYEPQTVEQAVEASIVWLLQGFAVVHPYARFYAGGNLEDDIVDSVAPYHFALERGAAGEIDLTRIGAIGGSWGGMMALFGAARAPDGAVPRAVVPIAPPSDFLDLWTHTEALPPIFPEPMRAAEFYSPYRRRIVYATGGPPGIGDFSAYRDEAVCAGLRSRVLVPHDEWDVLVPFEQTADLVATCPMHVEPLIWHRQGPIDFAVTGLDHGPFGMEPDFSTAYTFSFAWLGLQLADPSAEVVLTIASPRAMEVFVGTLRDEQLAGGDPAEALPRLIELASPRVQAFDPVASAFVPGALVVATALNAVYGTTYEPATVADALASGLPSP